MGAWDLYQRGIWYLCRFTKEDAISAQTAFEKAIATDPNFSAAYTGLAYLQLYDVMNGYSPDFERSLHDTEANARQALSLDQRDVLARFTLGRVHTLKKNYEEAIKEFERGMKLDPGFVHAYGSNPEDSIPFFKKAMREYDKAVESAEDTISQPNAMDWLHIFRGVVTLLNR